MTAWLTAHEPAVRLTLFFGVFLAMALWEARAPFRSLRVDKARRWGANLGLVLLNTALVRLLVPTAAAGASVFAATHAIGLLHAIALPSWAAVLLTLVAMDAVIWAQHLVFHRVKPLWRLHAVHHADLDFDVTTALRFHPLEIGLSLGIKVLTILALGAPLAGVIAFEVLLNASAMFNHGNVRLPTRWEPVVRTVLVTPDMHRVHHSAVPRETHSNFGFALSVWDRLFGTYRADVAAGQASFTIGLPEDQAPRVQGLGWMLARPFQPRRPTSSP